MASTLTSHALDPGFEPGLAHFYLAIICKGSLERPDIVTQVHSALEHNLTAPLVAGKLFSKRTVCL